MNEKEEEEEEEEEVPKKGNVHPFLGAGWF
jgi:hypothetical protein